MSRSSIDANVPTPTSSNGRGNPIFANNIETFPDYLVEKEAVFKKIFHFDSDTCHLSAEERDLAEKVFDEEKKTTVDFATSTLCDFVTEWKKYKFGDGEDDDRLRFGRSPRSFVAAAAAAARFSTDEGDCSEELKNHTIYDARNRSYYAPTKMYKPPRGRPAEFNPFRFISECDAKNQCYPLHIDNEVLHDGFDRLLYDGEDERTFEDVQNANSYADYNLRKIADVVAELNRMKDTGYKVLEICQETRVHAF